MAGQRAIALEGDIDIEVCEPLKALPSGPYEVGPQGRIDLDEWSHRGFRQAGYRVYFEGEDVTDNAYELDDIEGWIVLLVKSDGMLLRLHGSVEVLSPKQARDRERQKKAEELAMMEKF